MHARQQDVRTKSITGNTKTSVCICSCTRDINKIKFKHFCFTFVHALTTSTRENATEMTSHTKSSVIVPVLQPSIDCELQFTTSMATISEKWQTFAQTKKNSKPVPTFRVHVFVSPRQVASFVACNHSSVKLKRKHMHIQ